MESNEPSLRQTQGGSIPDPDEAGKTESGTIEADAPDDEDITDESLWASWLIVTLVTIGCLIGLAGLIYLLRTLLIRRTFGGRDPRPDATRPTPPPTVPDEPRELEQRNWYPLPGEPPLVLQLEDGTKVELIPGWYWTGEPVRGRYPVYDYTREAWGWIDAR